MAGEYDAVGFTMLPAFSYPDVISPCMLGQIGWHHRNVVLPWLPGLKLQKLPVIAQTGQDPILNRTFSGTCGATISLRYPGRK